MDVENVPIDLCSCGYCNYAFVILDDGIFSRAKFWCVWLAKGRRINAFWKYELFIIIISAIMQGRPGRTKTDPQGSSQLWNSSRILWQESTILPQESKWKIFGDPLRHLSWKFTSSESSKHHQRPWSGVKHYGSSRILLLKNKDPRQVSEWRILEDPSLRKWWFIVM